MFFSITKQPKNNYSHQYILGDFSIGTDAGWHEDTVSGVKVLYKGYADSESLVQLLPQIIAQTAPTLTGNFCVLVYTNNSIAIQTDRYRSFPI